MARLCLVRSKNNKEANGVGAVRYGKTRDGVREIMAPDLLGIPIL